MITSSTFMRARILASERAKILLRDTLKGLCSDYDIVLHAWVVLDDHYHLLIRLAHGKQLPNFMQRLHGNTSHQINLWDTMPGRRVWYSYWDTCIRNERDMWTKFNYIHYNPVKHGYVRCIQDWPYSSYHHYVQTKGETWLADSYALYPILHDIQHDDFAGPHQHA